MLKDRMSDFSQHESKNGIRGCYSGDTTRPTFEGPRFESWCSLSKCQAHKPCICPRPGLAETGGGLWHENPVGSIYLSFLE